MLKLMPSEHDPNDVNVLNQVITLINVRTCLENLRSDNVQEAIGVMELFLDSIISPIIAEATGCDETTQEFLEQELRKLCQYRKTYPQPATAYLMHADPETRARFIQMREQVSKTLASFAGDAP